METVLRQSFTDFELIICDNNSSDDTSKVASSIKDKRIKYLKNHQDLSMSENWEAAVTQATGQYVMVIADNDAIIQGALMFLYNVIRREESPGIVHWHKNRFYWPDINTYYSNRLALNVPQGEKVFQDGLDVMRQVLQDQLPFLSLPMIYTSAVSRTLLLRLREQTGSYFRSASPDVYSGFALSYVSKKHLSISTPITIAGTCAKSNGYNFQQFQTSAVVTDFFNLATRSSNCHWYKPHPDLPMIKTLRYGIYESFFHARDALMIDEIKISTKDALKDILENANFWNTKEISDVANLLSVKFEADPQLLDYTRSLLENRSFSLVPEPNSNRLGFHGSTLYLEGKDLGINNILDASLFMEGFYNYS